ncbi:MAG: DUF5686 family protein [Calditrichia bacterium]
MNHRLRFLSLCLVLAALPAFAQTTIRGTVTDAESGEALPAANIQIEGTYNGTISNDQGTYELELMQLPTTLLVSYIGYESAAVNVTRSSGSSIPIRLNPLTYELQAITVTDEDPAVTIMRRVIKEKQKWYGSLRTYQSEAYTRTSLQNDSGIVSIAESISEIYWDGKKGSREVVLSKDQSRNVDYDDNFATAVLIENFYDNDIPIQGFKMIGPTHPDALKHYHFKLIGQRKLDDRIVYDMELKPKGKLQPAFEGRISILDELFAMIDVDLRPRDNLIFPQPIQSWKLAYKQQFRNFGKTYWLPVDVRIDGTIKFGFPGLQFPPISYTQLTRLSGYQVNTALPDSLFESKVQRREEFSDSTGAGVQAARVPLSDVEEEAYESLDSTLTLNKAFKPTGMFARFVDLEDGDSDNNEGGGITKYVDFIPMLWFNRVAGLHTGMRLESSSLKKLKLRAEAGYRSEQASWNYAGGIGLRLFENNAWIELGAFRENATRNRSITWNRFFNSALPLIGSPDYFDYYQREGFFAEAGFDLPDALNTTLSFTYRQEDHSSLRKNTDYAFFDDTVIQRNNPNITEGDMRTLSTVLEYDDSYTPFGLVGEKGMRLEIEHSSDVLNSDFDFTRYQAEIYWKIPTFLRRRILPNAIDVLVSAGKTTGTVPAQRLGAIDTGFEAFRPFGTFRSLRNQPLEGDEHLAIFWEHNFRTAPFELLGLNTLARKNWGILLHGASGRTWLTDETAQQLYFLPRVSEETHHEIGVSVNGVFGLFRVDFTQQLNGNVGSYFGIGAARFF